MKTSSPRAEFSKSLLGNADRLDVVAEVGEYDIGERFYVGDIREHLESKYGTSSSSIAREIQLFVDFDLITRIGKGFPPDPKIVYYERIESTLMECLIGVADMAIQLAAGSQES